MSARSIGALAGLKDAVKPTQDARVERIADSFRRVPEYPRTRATAGVDVGLRDHPDFTQLKVYVRKDTKRAVQRQLLEDPAGSNLSELVELLLNKYLGR